MRMRERVAEVNPEALFADGFDKAIIGHAAPFGKAPVALYDTEKVIKILMKQDLTEEEAREHFDFNIAGSYVGENTPIFSTILRGG